MALNLRKCRAYRDPMAESLDVKADIVSLIPLEGTVTVESMNDASTLFVGPGKMREPIVRILADPSDPRLRRIDADRVADRGRCGRPGVDQPRAGTPLGRRGDSDVAQQHHRRIRAARRRCQQRAVGHVGAHPASTRMLASRTEECGTTASPPASTPIRTMSFSRHHQSRRLKGPSVHTATARRPRNPVSANTAAAGSW
jgi:hypothetical protein